MSGGYVYWQHECQYWSFYLKSETEFERRQYRIKDIEYIQEAIQRYADSLNGAIEKLKKEALK